MIITISREMGAGGSEVARQVAAALGWRVVDNEIVDQIAARSGLSPAEVREREERAPGFFERLLRMLMRAAPEILSAPADEDPEGDEAKLVKITESVVAELAREGRIVLVGRAAPAVLAGQPDGLHVKVVAPREDRVGTVAVRIGRSPADAAALVAQSDANRARYHQEYYHRDWNDASRYHMVLNTSALGIDQVVATVVGRAKTLWPAETRERRAT
ncbi:MAG: cytidylate kinase-like family protein [Gemmatimonadetes bacterium]|nr:cytidylate kinase-like family protein [Gemmatimonadota bacterium]